jgi:superfamily I DNA and RNA helicase
VIGTINATSIEDFEEEVSDVETNLDHVFSFVFSRLIRNSRLKKTRTDLLFPIDAIIYAPFVEPTPDKVHSVSPVVFTSKGVYEYLESTRVDALTSTVMLDITATIEGANGLIRPKPREITGKDPKSKGSLAGALESQIANFDQRQKHGYMTVLDGLQRIRGLAGSGKTVVLAMKAALTHLRNPEAIILYTFYTRSLYQFIQRLITRFYRQFDDRDPDWDRLRILHAWGGYHTEGVYFNACIRHGVDPISYSEASRQSNLDPFDYVCKNLLSSVDISPMFDYVFVDEGQDFPISFLKLCVELAKDTRVVYAYDELQTIFQKSPPAPSDILGPGAELSQDIVLYKCYRNPREILVVAHALGFGIYGPRIVQMLENKEHWEDIGYVVLEGGFKEGDKTVIERPPDNSLLTISEAQTPGEIVCGEVYGNFQDEVKGVASKIQEDIADGLRPDDILVIAVDDRYARSYLNNIAGELASRGIKSNNMHADSFGVRDFHRENRVTLSTVHKAKGNESFMVHIVGVDALFSSYAGVRERNMLFTAMTRAKGWVRVSGIGESAALCRKELEIALGNFPTIQFIYPSEEQLKIMRRDLEEKAVGKLRAERMLDKVLEEMSPEEIRRFIDQRSIPKGE